MTTGFDLRGAWQAMHDPLTGLPGRGLFYDRVQKALLVAGREELLVSLMVLHIDADQDGQHGPIDVEQRKLLLREVADRLTASMRTSDSAGRIDQEHFGVLLPHSEEEGASIVAGRIMVQLLRPVLLDDLAISMRCNVGVAVATHQATPIEAFELFARASEAIESARQRGGGFAAYDSPESRELLDSMRMG